jgi:transposase
MGYINGTDRDQVVLFPEVLDQYIDENNLVRAVAAFIEFLDFNELGFVRAEAAETGRPGYDPRTMLGIYLWGHLNGMRTTRRLERECRRNVELMWLTGKLNPDHKTIANFRKNNRQGLKGVMVEFRLWCEREEMFGKELAAVDGSKFKAVNSMSRNYTKSGLEKKIKEEEARIERYLKELDEADELEGEEEEKHLTVEELKKKIAGIKGYLDRHKELRQKIIDSGETQISLTDADSRLMRGGKAADVSYNIQVGVDSKHKLIVDFDVTSAIADQGMLAGIANKVKEALGVENLDVVADGGYFEGISIKQCEDENITTYVPVDGPDGSIGRGIFPRSQFSYDEERDLYICPAGEELNFLRETTKKKRQGKVKIRKYGTKACGGCALRAQCTTSKQGRQIERWEHQGVIDRQAARNLQHPEIQRQRGSLIEHVFGTLKRTMGHTYFVTRGRESVSAEFSLAALSYNFKRVASIMGIEKIKRSFAAKGA